MSDATHTAEPSAPAGSRRPIRARGTAWARSLTRRLIAAGVSPNAISITSVAWSAVGSGLLIASVRAGGAITAALLLGAIACIALRSVCNMLDGMVAIEGGRATPSGPIYNEFPDRVSDALFFIGAGVAVGTLPWGEQLGWLAALLAVATAYSRAIGAANGAGDDFGGPMAKPTRMGVLAIGCLVAALQAALSREPSALYVALVVINAGCVLTIALRLRRLVRRLERDA